MPGIILQHYGLEGSITIISDVMEQIPRRDSRIQDLLRPFVDKLRDKNDKYNQGKKRKREDENEVLTHQLLDQQKSCQPDKEANTDVFQKINTPWRISICDLKSSDVLETQGIVVKVIQKSGLRTYQSKDKVKKCFCYVAVADETGSDKLMVYGKDRYKEIKEGSSYLFRKLIKDDIIVKVTTTSNVAETKSVDVPEEFVMEAQKLIYPESPVYSVENAKSSADRTEVSVEGTITQVQSVGIRNIKIEIIGITKATKTETRLEAEVDHQVHTFVMSSRLLAKAFGFKLDGVFKESVLDNLPLSADAKIHGSKIKKITAAKKM